MTRIVAEGFVIVVSILLAFAIDAWWDSSRENRERADAIASLHADFIDTAAHLDQVQQMNTAALFASDTILSLLRGRSGSIEVPVATMVNAVRPPTPDPPLGALEALLSSGRLSLIDDPQLQEALAAWPAALGDLQSKGDLGQTFVYERLFPMLSSQTDVSDLVEGRMNQIMSTPSGGSLPAVADRGVMRLPATQTVVGLFEERRLIATLLRGNNWLRAQDNLEDILAGLERAQS